MPPLTKENSWELNGKPRSNHPCFLERFMPVPFCTRLELSHATHYPTGFTCALRWNRALEERWLIVGWMQIVDLELHRYFSKHSYALQTPHFPPSRSPSSILFLSQVLSYIAWTFITRDIPVNMPFQQRPAEPEPASSHFSHRNSRSLRWAKKHLRQDI